MIQQLSVTRRPGLIGLALLAGLLSALLLLPGVVLAQPPEPHQYIQEYVGPATCEMCHAGVTEDVMHSVHYTWNEKLDHYSPIPATIARINWLGMLNEDLGIPGGCGRCHTGAGAMPGDPDQATVADEAQIDCLICHSPNYDLGLRFPIQNEDGSWALTQDRTLLAARNAQRPTAANCLRCHMNVGGGPLLKRGTDFAPVADKHGVSSLGDVHAEAGLDCVDCHRSIDHQIMGYGPTLWSRDLPDMRLACEGCHTDAPHDNVILNDHFRLDCRSCHIIGAGGLVSRDWTAEPVYDPVNELYWPVSNVQEANSVGLTYRWFNGDPTKPGDPWPGERTDETAKIQPFKRYDAVVPADAGSGQPIPLKSGLYFTTGDLEKSIEAGAADSGMNYSGSWQPKELTAYLQTSHGVVGKEDALSCPDCHVPEGGKLNFAELGYTENEIAIFTSLSSTKAGERKPLQMQVIIPAAQPLPNPQIVSGNVEVPEPISLALAWNPLLAVLVSLALAALAGFWLWRQRPGA